MYDSVTPENILKANPHPQLVGGYINGKYKWSDADWALFPNSVHVRISVRASFLDGHVLDVETGDATPQEVPAWLTARRKAGADPAIYCNRSTWPQVAAACKAAGVAESHYFIATASGKAEIPDGAVAAQYLLDVAPGIDVSAVADHWPGVDPAPTTTTSAAPIPQEDPMQLRAGTQRSAAYSLPANASELVVSVAYDNLVIHQIDFWGPYGKAGDKNWLGGVGQNTVTDHYAWVVPVPKNTLYASIRWTLANDLHEGSVIAR
ncbi:hypothetical protein AB0383_48750 [Amycolatopsis sp. NPDC051373]|uniref:hypothetical protein n=1 Tax=Amycolatopsis sp. NPDC051373 TaxID=3155801 RepID=UPI00344F8939